MSSAPVTVREFVTNDGVTLRYHEAGAGRPLVMIPGWSQSAQQFKYQLEGLADRYRVLAVDMRGHGDSDKPSYGYRISRMAKDVYELLAHLDLQDVTILGHSMGSSIIWSYCDLFGPERLARLIIADQAPAVMVNPDWSEEEKLAAGAIFTAESLLGTCSALAGPDGATVTAGFIGGMVTGACPPETTAWMVERNMLMPRAYAAALLLNHCMQDWRDVIRRINLPTLIVGGRVSIFPWQSQEWIAQQIPGARVEIFEEEEGGQHFAFVEGYPRFNQLVADFIG